MRVAVFVKRRAASLRRLDRTGTDAVPVRRSAVAPSPSECHPSALVPEPIASPTAPAFTSKRERVRVPSAVPGVLSDKALATFAKPEAAALVTAYGGDHASSLAMRQRERQRALVRAQYVLLRGEPVHVLDVDRKTLAAMGVPRRDRDAIRAAAHAAKHAPRVPFDPTALTAAPRTVIAYDFTAGKREDNTALRDVTDNRRWCVSHAGDTFAVMYPSNDGDKRASEARLLRR